MSSLLMHHELMRCPCRDKDPREDLKTLARMYCTALEMQMRDRNRCGLGFLLALVLLE